MKHTRLLHAILLHALLGVFLALPVRAEEVVIVGTGDGMHLLDTVGAAFNKAHPAVTITVPTSIGSSGGIKAVGGGKARIGRIARDIKSQEEAYGLTRVPIAKVAVSFFVNPGVGVSALSIEQVVGIYGGRITNWKEVGGADVRIRVVRREDGDSSLGVLRRSFPGFSDLAITAKSKITATTQENLEVVASTPRAIGFGPYPGAKAHPVKILTVGGLHPVDKDYPYFTTLSLIFKEVNRTGSVATFIDFLTSPAGHQAIRQASGTPF